jgi:hypothetical protein
MKAQRRHELKENVLARELDQMRGLLSRYGNWIAGGIAAVVVVFLVVWYYHSRSVRELSEEQARLDSLVSEPNFTDEQRLEGLTGLADHARSPVVGASAAVTAGDMLSERYLDGMRRTPPEDSPQTRQQAEKSYRLAIEKYPERKLFAARAHFGLAVLAETAGDFATAKGEYEQVVRLVDATYPVAVEAQGRLRTLPLHSQPVRFATTTQATQRAATRPAGRGRPAPATATVPAVPAG